MSLEILKQKIKEKANPTVVGLDVKMEFIPDFIKEKYNAKYENRLKAAGKSIYKFNREIIDAVAGIVPAVKPQCAYYEMYGYHGVKALYKTIEYAKSRGLYVIADGKRNDIGATSEAYANAFLGEVNLNGELIFPFPADALTVNAYLGSDGVTPFTNNCEKYDKAIFILVKTSNPSSSDIQDLRIENGLTVYEHVADLIRTRTHPDMVGAVVGATYPEQLVQLRERMSETFFLIPGYGAQGGGVPPKNILEAADGSPLGIINNSRGIIAAWQKNGYSPTEFAFAAREACEKMRDEINSAK